MTGFDFATPLAFLLLPLPLLVALWRRGGADAARGIRISSAVRDRVGGVVTVRQPPSRSAVLRWLAWGLVVVALAGPQAVAATAALPATGRDVMFVLDLSGSMVAQDMLDKGKPVTRIALLKTVGSELIRRLAGNRVGLVVFAEHALAAAPLSFDAAGVAKAMNRVEIGLVGRSTAIGDGLGLAVKRLSESKSPTRIIILESDGSNNAGSMDPTGVAALAHSLGIKVYTIGFGPRDTLTPDDDPDAVDFVALQKYAHAGGGEAFRVHNAAEFDATARKIERLVAGQTAAPPAVLHRQFWPLPAAMGMICAFCMVATTRKVR